MTGTGLDIGRRVKAKRIAAALASLGADSDIARKLSPAEWIMADKLSVQQTGRGGPKRGEEWKVPSEVTRAYVIEILDRPAAPHPGDPRDEDIP